MHTHTFLTFLLFPVKLLMSVLLDVELTIVLNCGYSETKPAPTRGISSNARHVNNDTKQVNSDYAGAGGGLVMVMIFQLPFRVTTVDLIWHLIHHSHI